MLNPPSSFVKLAQSALLDAGKHLPKVDKQWVEAFCQQTGIHLDSLQEMTEYFQGTAFISPEIASTILATRNVGNRKVSQPQVKDYEVMLRNGTFLGEHTDPVIIGRDGLLRNAQHRLLAIVKANIGARFVITFGASLELIANLDSVRRRSISDQTRITTGIVFSKEAKAVCTSLIGDGRPTTTVRTNLTMPDLVGCYIAYKESIDEAIKLLNKTKVRSLKLAPLRAAVVCGMKHDPEKTRAFVRDLLSGNGSKGHPPKTLREWLESGSESRKAASQEEIFRKSIRAISAFLNDEKLLMLVDRKLNGEWQNPLSLG